MDCLHCGKQTPLHKQTGKPRKYCNKLCSNNHYKKRQLEKRKKEKEDLLKEIKANCLHCGKQTPLNKLTGKPKKYCKDYCRNSYHSRKHLDRKRKEKEELLKEIEAKGLVSVHEAAEIMGHKSTNSFRNNPVIPGVVFKGHSDLGKRYNKQDLLRVKENRQKKKEQAKKRKQALLKPKNLTDDEWYEIKLKRKIVEVGPPESVKKNARLLRNWDLNAEMMRLYEEEGVVTKLPCKVCGESLPYWRFLPNFKLVKERNGRDWVCKSCCKDIRPKSTPSPETAFLNRFISSICQDLSFRQGERCEMGSKEIWKKLEENLGYDRESLLEHIKSQWEDWMNLNNRGHSMSLDNPNWQLDHIKPKSSFSYTSIEDEGFKECWGLPNLRPVETWINQLKGRHASLHEGLVKSFMRGLHEPSSAGGIWDHLPYSAQEARESLKKKMTVGMGWANATSGRWTIEHIISQDELPYKSFRDENFKKLWALENLRPVWIKS